MENVKENIKSEWHTYILVSESQRINVKIKVRNFLPRDKNAHKYNISIYLPVSSEYVQLLDKMQVVKREVLSKYFVSSVIGVPHKATLYAFWGDEDKNIAGYRHIEDEISIPIDRLQDEKSIIQNYIDNIMNQLKQVFYYNVYMFSLQNNSTYTFNVGNNIVVKYIIDYVYNPYDNLIYCHHTMYLPVEKDGTLKKELVMPTVDIKYNNRSVKIDFSENSGFFMNSKHVRRIDFHLFIEDTGASLLDSKKGEEAWHNATEVSQATMYKIINTMKENVLNSIKAVEEER